MIDELTFKKAQIKPERNKTLASRNVKHEYLLRGYLYCGMCGQRYEGAIRYHQGKQGLKEYKYYRCSTSSRIKSAQCSNRAWITKRLEAIVWSKIEEAIMNPQTILAGIEGLKKESSKAESYQVELDKINSRLV